MNASCHRRGFLAAAGYLIGGATVSGWASLLQAAPSSAPSLSSGVRLIDSHTHFYDPKRPQGVPWPPAEDPLFYRSVWPADYRALSLAQPVHGTVVVEASPWVEDNQWVLDLAAHDPFLVGFVGNLPVGSAGFAGHLKRFAANRLFRGIRIRDRKLDGALDQSAFLQDLKLLADSDLALDLVGGQEILPFAARLSQEVPQLRIIIDHLAGVAVDGKAPPAGWLTQMRALAGRPNLFFKLSGLVEGTGRTDGSAPQDAEFYRPVLNAMFSLFGPDRLIYASNWPVSERFAPLAVVQRIVWDYCQSHSRSVQEKVFSGNSQVAYRWLERAAASK